MSTSTSVLACRLDIHHSLGISLHFVLCFQALLRVFQVKGPLVPWTVYLDSSVRVSSFLSGICLWVLRIKCQWKITLLLTQAQLSKMSSLWSNMDQIGVDNGASLLTGVQFGVHLNFKVKKMKAKMIHKAFYTFSNPYFCWQKKESECKRMWKVHNQLNLTDADN